jgi:hypothetical protein
MDRMVHSCKDALPRLSDFRCISNVPIAIAPSKILLVGTNRSYIPRMVLPFVCGWRLELLGRGARVLESGQIGTESLPELVS